tara:strand:- start:284 stop:859 length:576 start_codon:yes stop_codon:yes gene_type:complete
MSLTSEQAKKLLEADAALAVQRIKSGKNLTQGHRAYLLNIAGEDVPSDGLAKNQVELAKILGVSRSSIVKWSRQSNAPKAKANGKHDIAAWLEFIKENGLKGSNEVEADDLKSRRLLAQCLKIEAELEILRSNWLPLRLIERYMEDVFTACRAKILQCQIDDQAKDEILNELSRLQDNDFGVRANPREAEQ